jgi:signal transduction histidine kinase
MLGRVRIAEDEQRRVSAIREYDAVRKPPRDQLRSVLELATQIADVPMATINIITDVEQHQIVAVGFEPSVCAREDSMCAVTVQEGAVVALADASTDPRFARNPFVTGQLGRVRFYVAHPLVTRHGVVVGTLCVFDEQPRELDRRRLAGLATLAERVVDVFELRLRSREVALSLMENQAVQAELERSNDRLAAFAGQVSHDLKTPLTTLSLTLSLIREQLERGELGADSISLLERVINGSTRMSALIDDILDFARLGGTLRETDVDLGFVLGEVLEDLGPELTGATLLVEELPTVVGDRAQLRSVLQNLLVNCAKYRSGERPLEVRIAARHVGWGWRIEVTDNGRGVPPAERHRVFEPLARADESVEGTGIGLATCRRIVGAHGGRIGIDPTVVEGSRFWFEIPE